MVLIGNTDWQNCIIIYDTTTINFELYFVLKLFNLSILFAPINKKLHNAKQGGRDLQGHLI
ncbi:hypothetical protein D5R40_08765 [Okeania hirsuta]|uniref:Uncharacterized protein n=1 Tax=Okeania hirsuta TaxID=1458930 RepID=A0A3N6PBI8_9CYAN|nr:hypothetical protein D4Z78_26245 [Okeania hirsuta]RQH47503.1 hypothetical protein D5R40_08765 [Okeania hirsuta]